MAEGTRLQQVEMTVDTLRRAFNVNHAAYAKAVSALDGHFSVLRAVINDIHRGEVTVDADGNIDWDTYYGWYNEFLAKQKQTEEEAQAGKMEVVEKIPEEQVFGGDYGSGH